MRKIYNCPATEVMMITVAYGICEVGSETQGFTTGSAIPDEGR